MVDVLNSNGPEDDDDICPVCEGMGYICSVCRHPDGDCTCADGPQLIECPECSD